MHWTAVLQLALARLREFVREPVALFWVYGFPQIVLLALGIAFTDRPPETFPIALLTPGLPEQQRNAVLRLLATEPRLAVRLDSPGESLRQVAVSAVLLVRRDSAGRDSSYEIRYDPDRPDSCHARAVVEAVLLRQGTAAPTITIREQRQQGSRYIDFLVPGLLAVGIMGGSLVGVGYTLVELRMRRLLRIYLATPLRRHELFAGLMLARLAFLIPEVLLVLLVARLVFGVVPVGHLLTLFVVLLIGTLAFLAIGLLLGARGQALEAVSGWLSLLMLVQWTFSGVFFSRLVYPESWQPWLRLLPLTALVDATRAVMQEGAGLSALGVELLVLLGWSVLTFPLAWWLFREH
jgi:ABC-2 type transport system permease protein